jgi:hypothetical protein
MATQSVFWRAGINVQRGTFTNYLTVGDAYVDMPTGALSVVYNKTKHMTFAATTNALKVQVLGSIDGGATYPFTVQAEFTLTAGAAATTYTWTTPYSDIKVQVKPSVAGQHGTLAVAYLCASW